MYNIFNIVINAKATVNSLLSTLPVCACIDAAQFKAAGPAYAYLKADTTS